MAELELSAARTMCRYDNLLSVLVAVYYKSAAAGAVPTQVLGGEGIAALEAVTGQQETGTPTFKGLPVAVSGVVPPDELWFMREGAVVARVTHIS